MRTSPCLERPPIERFCDLQQRISDQADCSDDKTGLCQATVAVCLASFRFTLLKYLRRLKKHSIVVRPEEAEATVIRLADRLPAILNVRAVPFIPHALMTTQRPMVLRPGEITFVREGPFGSPHLQRHRFPVRQRAHFLGEEMTIDADLTSAAPEAKRCPSVDAHRTTPEAMVTSRRPNATTRTANRINPALRGFRSSDVVSDNPVPGTLHRKNGRWKELRARALCAVTRCQDLSGSLNPENVSEVVRPSFPKEFCDCTISGHCCPDLSADIMRASVPRVRRGESRPTCSSTS